MNTLVNYIYTALAEFLLYFSPVFDLLYVSVSPLLRGPPNYCATVYYYVHHFFMLESWS